MINNYLNIAVGGGSKFKCLLFSCFLTITLVSSSCDSFLETLPDNRTQLDNQTKIAQLLVSAYSNSNYSVVAELSSDNFVDNNAILPVNLAANERMHDELYAWQPVTSSTQEDSPSNIWESCYAAIASANNALLAIDKLQAEMPTLNLKAQKGEALFCRAYGHFLLVSIFCQSYKDESASALDLGIPYITKPETVVRGKYTRETVQSVYAKIQQDLEDGFPLILITKLPLPLLLVSICINAIIPKW
jgi:hypothetical protein